MKYYECPVCLGVGQYNITIDEPCPYCKTVEVTDFQGHYY